MAMMMIETKTMHDARARGGRGRWLLRHCPLDAGDDGGGWGGRSRPPRD
jgi:hypothetical protein